MAAADQIVANLLAEKLSITERLGEIVLGDTQALNEYRDSLSKRLKAIDENLASMGVGPDGVSSGPYEIHTQAVT